MIKEKTYNEDKSPKILVEGPQKYAKTRNIDSLRNELALIQKKHIDLLDDYSNLLKNLTEQ